MRKNAGSWVVKVILGAIAVVFIFFMGGGGRIGGGAASVATVGGEKISVMDYQRAENRNQTFYREQYGDRLTPDLLRALDIPALTLNQLVDQAVLREEASRLGLRVPDEALRAEIREIGAFQRNGQFSPEVYRIVMQRQGMSAAIFEAAMRSDLLVEQLVDVIRRGVHVTEQEAFDQYAAESEKMVLEYVKVSADDLQDQVEVSEDGLKSYYEDHREDFRVPERARIRYVAYEPDAFVDPSSVGDEEIEEYYELNLDREFTHPETVSARHILKTASKDEAERAKAREAIDAIAKRLAGGEDFATVAKAESDDKGSAVTGGDLGAFPRGQMVKPFEDAAFALEPGQTSDVVETDFGYHIIRVYDHKEAGTDTLEQAHDQIAKKLAQQTARDKAFDAAADDAASVRGGASLEEAAESRKLKVEVTSPLTPDDTLPGVGSARDLVGAALDLAGPDDTTDPIKIGDTYYVVQIDERLESYIPELADVRDAVTEAYRKELAGEAAEKRATALLDDLKAGKTAKEVADAAGLESGETSPFTKRGAFIPGVGNLAGVKELAYQSGAAGEVLPRAFSQGSDAYVFVIKSREAASREDFDKIKDQRLAALKRDREQAAVGEFVRQLKERTDIAYNQEILAQLMPR